MTADLPPPGRRGPGRGYRVLVVDDEKPLADVVARYLLRDGYDVTVVHDGPAALQCSRRLDPDVVILDLGLPGLDGVDVCRGLREFSDCYIVMLTARAEEPDMLAGLRAGADDYMTKPFSPRELVARVQVMLRRPRQQVAKEPPAGAQLYVFGPLSIDVSAREVHLDGDRAVLTRTEFDVLQALAARAGQAMTRRQIIDGVWGETWVGDEQLVDVHVAHLRRKLGDPASGPRFIHTVRGVGYRLNVGQVTSSPEGDL
ncbi:response regulator transcription factor [Ornithinimicrobium cryptoxanthini]|uniref:response regulator transcription factor n=1 Tax=Ornithinimicrobium cryptoxanthini TaxID=2934161 RepID=UPI002118EAF5|nr:response regulator transcription factor [Ornithinimicrobium cryptoxanthini]